MTDKWADKMRGHQADEANGAAYRNAAAHSEGCTKNGLQPYPPQIDT